jgi:3-oxoadipate enol-lactonase
LPIFASMLRSRWYPTFVHSGLPRIVTTGHDLEPYLEWLEAEVHRGDASAITQAGWALSRFDSRSWAGNIGVPAGSLITTRDRLVTPKKQRRLAAALSARTRELAADHGAPWEQPRQFASLTAELVDDVIARSAPSAVVSNAT